MARRAITEFLATVAALAAVTVYLQLQDPTSTTRLWLEQKRDELDEWSIRTKVDNLLKSVHTIEEGT